MPSRKSRRVMSVIVNLCDPCGTRVSEYFRAFLMATILRLLSWPGLFRYLSARSMQRCAPHAPRLHLSPQGRGRLPNEVRKSGEGVTDLSMDPNPLTSTPLQPNSCLPEFGHSYLGRSRIYPTSAGEREQIESAARLRLNRTRKKGRNHGAKICRGGTRGARAEGAAAAVELRLPPARVRRSGEISRPPSQSGTQEPRGDLRGRAQDASCGRLRARRVRAAGELRDRSQLPQGGAGAGTARELPRDRHHRRQRER